MWNRYVHHNAHWLWVISLWHFLVKRIELAVYFWCAPITVPDAVEYGCVYSGGKSVRPSSSIPTISTPKVVSSFARWSFKGSSTEFIFQLYSNIIIVLSGRHFSEFFGYCNSETFSDRALYRQEILSPNAIMYHHHALNIWKQAQYYTGQITHHRKNWTADWTDLGWKRTNVLVTAPSARSHCEVYCKQSTSLSRLPTPLRSVRILVHTSSRFSYRK